MKRFLLLTGTTLGVIVGWLVFDPPAPRSAGANSFGPPPAKTQAPGEGVCTDCHGGHVVNPDALGSVTIDGVPTSYMPGQTYPLTVTVTRTGQQRWGFELTSLKASDNTMAGTLTLVNTITRIVTLNSRNYIEQTTVNGGDGTFSGQANGSWDFNWTAPAAGAGSVTFYAAGNAADGSGTTTGDFIYTKTASSLEGSATDVSSTTWGKIKMLYR